MKILCATVKTQRRQTIIKRYIYMVWSWYALWVLLNIFGGKPALFHILKEGSSVMVDCFQVQYLTWGRCLWFYLDDGIDNSFFFFFFGGGGVGAHCRGLRDLKYLDQELNLGPHSESLSPNHWTAREFPKFFSFCFPISLIKWTSVSV